MFTPTTTPVFNVTSSSAAPFQNSYMRVGSTVTVGGRFTAKATAPGIAVVDLSVPVPSNFALVECAGGAGVGENQAAATITTNGTADVVSFRWNAPVGGVDVLFTYSYTYNIV
jgi:hypothetical protein